jgi:hypothetical protein
MLAGTDALATLDLSSLPSNVRDVLLAQQAVIRAEPEAREQESAAQNLRWWRHGHRFLSGMHLAKIFTGT